MQPSSSSSDIVQTMEQSFISLRGWLCVQLRRQCDQICQLLGEVKNDTADEALRRAIKEAKTKVERRLLEAKKEATATLSEKLEVERELEEVKRELEEVKQALEQAVGDASGRIDQLERKSERIEKKYIDLNERLDSLEVRMGIIEEANSRAASNRPGASKRSSSGAVGPSKRHRASMA